MSVPQWDHVVIPSSGTPDMSHPPPTSHVGDEPDVALVAWPQDEALRRQLAAAHRPRLLLIDGQQAAPLAADELEDWVRFPLDPDELAVRIATLAERARDVPPRPIALRLDDDGVLHADDRWVALPPLEASVIALLLEHPGHVVRRAELARQAWPAGPPADQRAVDGVVKRLRRRVRPLGVRIHTLTAQGFLLDYAPEPPDAPGVPDAPDDTRSLLS